MRPLFLEPGDPLVFPDPREADDEGLVAIGGDLASDRLLAAYGRGIFPWFDVDTPPLWWSPDPRTVLPRDRLRVSRSLRRTWRRRDWRLTWNAAFDRVMLECGRRRRGGTWIVPAMRKAYGELHRLGHAHSLEVWEADALIGGIYGVQCGGLFAAESMFHRRTDASKIALVACVQTVCAAGIELFDVQMTTSHLLSMGAVEWPRGAYLDEVMRVRDLAVDLSGSRPAFA